MADEDFFEQFAGKGSSLSPRLPWSDPGKGPALATRRNSNSQGQFLMSGALNSDKHPSMRPGIFGRQDRLSEHHTEQLPEEYAEDSRTSSLANPLLEPDTGDVQRSSVSRIVLWALCSLLALAFLVISIIVLFQGEEQIVSFGRIDVDPNWKSQPAYRQQLRKAFHVVSNTTAFTNEFNSIYLPTDLNLADEAQLIERHVQGANDYSDIAYELLGRKIIASFSSNDLTMENLHTSRLLVKGSIQATAKTIDEHGNALRGIRRLRAKLKQERIAHELELNASETKLQSYEKRKIWNWDSIGPNDHERNQERRTRISACKNAISKLYNAENWVDQSLRHWEIIKDRAAGLEQQSGLMLKLEELASSGQMTPAQLGVSLVERSQAVREVVECIWKEVMEREAQPS
ncbi:uncharacterized protein KY384_002886 [Bacidia gigantensis]|uniref:uncharacterized protein n=1 Tax=Bacidia gigantensis TaxID=2732470 RepID=UPI001D043890|nr:uncharacterized protein KY384_002886 [Bacidia gigantensis]KAG8532401.1 hypothetical protein KY384_002886 [Bacidia gigantensis]